jgi:Carboxypeptidase regulatory-like domain
MVEPPHRVEVSISAVRFKETGPSAHKNRRSTKPAVIPIANYWIRHYAPPMGHRTNESKTRKGCSFLAVVLCLVPACLFAQPVMTIAVAGLPEAPQAQSPRQTTESRQRADSSIVGTVFDMSGDLVPGALVTLVQSGHPDVTIASGADGKFAFPNLTAGNYTVRFTLEGIRPYTSPQIVLRPGQEFELRGIALAFTSANVSVMVTASPLGIAEEELRLQEKQRLLGVFPNFNMSYVWNAAPLTTGLKFRLAARSMVDPVVFLTTAVGAGLDQANDGSPDYGQGAAGFAKRFGAGFGNEVSNRLLSGAIYPSLFHQDPRFFYQGSGSKKSRALYAVTRAFVTRGDNGEEQPNYSRILGVYTSAALNNAYHPSHNHSAGRTFAHGSIALGAYSADSIFREFVFRRITPKVPGKAKATP